MTRGTRAPAQQGDTPLPSGFYEQDTLAVAQALIGCRLLHLEGDSTTGGMIVETEAYLRGDPAAHSFHGKTAANSVLFGPPGHAHVFFIYGMYWCMNVVTGQGEGAGAVLIRALEPLEGIPVMQARRGTTDPRLLCSGPGRLTRALGITGEFNGVSLVTGPLRILAASGAPGEVPAGTGAIVQTTRIGISRATDRPYRFYREGSPFVSHPQARRPPRNRGE